RFFVLSRSLNESEQLDELNSLRSQLPYAPDKKFPGRFQYLSVQQLHALRQSGIEIGAHTVNHPILATLSAEAARSEIAASKSQLEDSAGVAVRAFAYPFGAPNLDYHDREREYASNCGFLFAFAGEGSFV